MLCLLPLAFFEPWFVLAFAVPSCEFLTPSHPSAFYHYKLFSILCSNFKTKTNKKEKKRKKGKGLIILRNWHRAIYNTSLVINHTCYHRSTQFAQLDHRVCIPVTKESTQSTQSGSQTIPVTTGRPNRSIRVTNHTCYHKGRTNSLNPGH